MNAKQLKELVIIPVLKELDSSGGPKYSETAVNLLLGTAAQESAMGYYLKQVKGPALGIYQMEPATAWWLAEKYSDFVLTYLNEVYTVEEALIVDLAFQTAMCRFKYYSIPEPLPRNPNDILALAKYWKKYYNTPLGKGTEEEFIKNYNRYVK